MYCELHRNACITYTNTHARVSWFFANFRISIREYASKEPSIHCGRGGEEFFLDSFHVHMSTPNILW